MQAGEIVFIIALTAAVLAIFIAAFRTKKPVRALAASALAGVAALFVVSLTGTLTGVSLAVNAWTLLTAVVAGVPGVILMLSVRLIWQV